MAWVFGILLGVSLVAVAGLTVAHRSQLRALRALRQSDQTLTAQLRQRLLSETAKLNELEALLASMTEGVLAVDLSGKILSLNRAGAKLLQLPGDRAIGQRLHEVVRNTRIQELLDATLNGGGVQYDEFQLPLAGDSLDNPGTIQAQTAPLQDGGGDTIGALVVMHDVTQVRRLESVRQEFVANVSHEVKTPVAAIKAAVETLLDDHDHTMAPDDRANFQRMIARQADRLDAIVEDLLALARIEQEPDAQPESMDAEFLAPILGAAVETCTPKAAAKRITVQVDCPPHLAALLTPNLIEQAVVNLVDNAIKYSDDGTTISVAAYQDAAQAVIAVTDQGRGIDPQHLPRIFERFYRTDRARSRAMGGTGLGLAIVKHIAVAHGGRVGVQSQVGRGSTFRLYLRGLPQESADASAAIPPAA